MIVVEPSEFSVVTISSTVNSVVDTMALTVNVLLLFVELVTVIRSRTASLPDPVNAVVDDEIVLVLPLFVKLMSVPVMSDI